MLERSQAVLRTMVLLVALTAVAHAQGPGGGSSGGNGPGGSGGSGRGGGNAGGQGNRPDDGRSGGLPAGSSGTAGTSMPDGSRPATSSMPSSVTNDDLASSGLQDFLRGPEGALDAVKADQALPLDQIVAATRHITSGQIIDAQLSAVSGALRYEVKVLETDGAVRRFLFDARTAQLAEVR